MDLQAAEIEVLLRACSKYRATIPSYLQASQPELAVIDALVARLKKLLLLASEE